MVRLYRLKRSTTNIRNKTTIIGQYNCHRGRRKSMNKRTTDIFIDPSAIPNNEDLIFSTEAAVCRSFGLGVAYQNTNKRSSLSSYDVIDDLVGKVICFDSTPVVYKA